LVTLLGNRVLGSPTVKPYLSIFLASVLVCSVMNAIIPGTIWVQTSAASITIIPPQDKSVTSSSSTSTKVALGSPKVSGTSDLTPTITNNAPGFVQAPAGAVGYWSFDDDLRDQSGGRNDAKAKGDAHLVGGFMGNSLKLDGDKDFVAIDNNWNLQLTGAFTLSTWVKLDTLSPDGSYVRILEKGTSPGEKYWMFYVKSTKKIGFGFINADSDVNLLTAKTDWQAGKWYHIVGTYDPAGTSNNMKIYVDGTLDNKGTRSGKANSSTQPLLIGAKSTTDKDFWEGEIDEVRIYRKALTQTEVTALNKAPFVSLPRGANIITWKATDDDGNTASSVQVVNVAGTNTGPTTSLAINGVRYTDSTTGNTFVTSGSHFDLHAQSGVGVKSTSFRFFESSELLRPNFSSGTYFQIIGSDGEYLSNYFSIDNNGNKEQLREKKVVLDNSAPTTFLTVLSGTSKVKLTATDPGAGLGTQSASGIYYKLDSATSFTFLRASSIEVANVVNGAHTISYYSIDNLGNQEAVRSAKFTGTSTTVCASGCNYSNLQTAVNSLPSGGGRIYIKAGSYEIASSINLKTGTILDFQSGASIYFTGDTIPLFKGTGISNVEVIGGTITAERTGVKAFTFTSTTGIKITGTKFDLVKGDNSNAIHCIDCKSVFISGINANSAARLIDIKSDSRITDGRSSNIWVQDSFFDDTAIEGIKVNYSTDVHIIGNTISNSAENGIDIGWNLDSEVRDNKLTKTGYPNGAAIHTDSATGANIVNNYIDTTGQTAIPVYRASNINVIGNTVINAGDQGVSIITKLEPSANINVKLNHIIDPVGIGIYQSPEQSQVDISFNTIEQMPAGVLPISITGSNPTTLVYGNTVIP
jgi:hypothetical protein